MPAAGSDYTSTIMDVTFDPGSTMATVSVPISDDTAKELDEAFTATVSTTDSNVMIGDDDTAMVTILDNDGGDLIS